MIWKEIIAQTPSEGMDRNNDITRELKLKNDEVIQIPTRRGIFKRLGRNLPHEERLPSSE